MFLLPMCCVPMPSLGVPATFICCVVSSVRNCLNFFIGCMQFFLWLVHHMGHIVVLHSAWMCLTVCLVDACVCSGWCLACLPVGRCSCTHGILLLCCLFPVLFLHATLPRSICCCHPTVWISSVACVLLHCTPHLYECLLPIML